jgi:hypothetical protein
LVFGFKLHSQDEPIYVLEIRRGEVCKILYEWEKATIRYEGETYNGLIKIMNKDSININDKIFEVAKIESVSFITKGSKTTGRILALSSIALFSIGIGCFVEAENAVYDIGQSFYTIIGAFLTGAGITLLATGVSISDFKETEYRRKEGWKYTLVESL